MLTLYIVCTTPSHFGHVYITYMLRGSRHSYILNIHADEKKDGQCMWRMFFDVTAADEPSTKMRKVAKK